MKRFMSVALAVALVGLAAPSDSSAQAVIALGAGPTIPMGDYGDFAKTGYLGHAGVNVPVGEAGLTIGGHGFFGSNGHDDVDGDKTNLYGGVGSVGYQIATSGSIAPSVFGMVGYLVHSYKSESFPAAEGSDSGLAAGAGVGIGFPLGGISGVVQGWWLTGFGDVDGTQILGIDVGVGIPVGGDGM